jgi:hypothetical protein
MMTDYDSTQVMIAVTGTMQEVGMLAQRLFEESRVFLTAAYVLRPKLFPDGNQWCALYGENLQEGVAGFGDTPAEAMLDFDRNFHSQKLPMGTPERP